VTPGQRRLRAKIAANARWSQPMARADQAAAARTAIFRRLERQVDPGSELDPAERAVLVRAAARRLSAELNAARIRKRAAARKGHDSLPDGTSYSDHVAFAALSLQRPLVCHVVRVTINHGPGLPAI
jgi:hypothetical protein